MKKNAIILFFILLTAVTVKAQEFKKIKVGLGFGYGLPGGEGAKGGILFAFEPGYRINDFLLVNLRSEFALLARGTASPSTLELDLALIGSYVAIGQYYFSAGNFRPYAGAGTGLFTFEAETAVAGSGGKIEVTAAENKLGGVVRAGFDAGHFTFNVDYNIIPASTGTNGEKFKNSYLGFRIGGYFGGGRK